ncbi:MAG: helix-turn-helix domain-containing protein [Candidatus Zixiibacteriota bacterium]|jgi:excisionase family DNA binding protein
MVERAFWGVEEVAEYLNESPHNIYDWVARRRIPFYKRGRRLQFNIEEIKKWDRERNYRPTVAERERETTIAKLGI